MSTLEPKRYRWDYAAYAILFIAAIAILAYFATPYMAPGADDVATEAPAAEQPAVEPVAPAE